jgi:hypothetical protein
MNKMVTTNDSLDKHETIAKDYSDTVRVVKIEREGDIPIYRFEAPYHPVKDSDTKLEFEDPDKALMYAAVYAACDSFREEKTGRRGIPPEVASRGKMEMVAYLTTQRGYSIESVARVFGISEQRVYEYRSRIRAKADEKAEEWETEKNQNSETQE